MRDLTYNNPSDVDRAVADGNGYRYVYPTGIDLAPNSSTHQNLVSHLMQFVQHSHSHMSRNYSRWEEMDRVLKVYSPVDEGYIMEKYPRYGTEVWRKREASDYDPLEQIIMPVTYGNMETLLTYMMTALYQSPIFPLEGVGPEDEEAAYLMQHVIDFQAHRSRLGLNLHTQWRDAFAYGFGAIYPYWHVERGRRPYVDVRGVDVSPTEFEVTSRKRKSRDGVIWEGVKCRNISPYYYFPDPSAPIHAPQEGMFTAWMQRESLMALLADEASGDSDLFNVKYLKHLSGKSKYMYGRHTNEPLPGMDNLSRPVDVCTIYIMLIPNDWGLGSNTDPEKWMFAIAGDGIIIQAQRVTLWTEQDVIVAAPDYDGHSIVPTSRLQNVMDIQTLVDFLHTSHIANVRKVINDMLIVDPSMIVMSDLNDPKPGKIIRTRRSTWGRGNVNQFIQQLNVQDVTQQNIFDAQALTQVAFDAVGASDNLRGNIPRRNERVSATEASDVRTSGLARFEKAARIIGMQSMQPLAMAHILMTQQFMEKDVYAKMVGEIPPSLQEEYGSSTGKKRVISPLDVIGMMDIRESDGTQPGSASADSWIQVLQIASASPETMAILKMPQLIRHIARALGAKNVNEFINTQPAPTVAPDEVVAQQEQAGNIVPSGDGAVAGPPPFIG